VGGVRGLPLEAQLSRPLGLTASPAARPSRQGPAAGPGRGTEVSGTGGWRMAGDLPAQGRRDPANFLALGAPPHFLHVAHRDVAPEASGPDARAAGPKPLGATIELARPRSPSNATLVPRPPADLKTLPLFRWRLRLTASSAASPSRQGLVARPGRGNGGLGKPFRRLAPRPKSRMSLTGTDVAPEASGPGARGPLSMPTACPRGARRSPAAARAGPPARQHLARSHWQPPLSRHGPLAPARPPLPPRHPPSSGPRPWAAFWPPDRPGQRGAPPPSRAVVGGA
ncbi:hypothetical protein EI555_015149, partial [Monodon monoceros]